MATKLMETTKTLDIAPLIGFLAHQIEGALTELDENFVKGIEHLSIKGEKYTTDREDQRLLSIAASLAHFAVEILTYSPGETIHYYKRVGDGEILEVRGGQARPYGEYDLATIEADARCAAKKLDYLIHFPSGDIANNRTVIDRLATAMRLTREAGRICEDIWFQKAQSAWKEKKQK